MRKVWVTRTQPGAEKTAMALRAKGFDPIIMPLLKVAPPDLMPRRPEEQAVLVFTSGNGLRAFCELTDRREWPVLTVGDATAALARKVGFSEVKSAEGTSAELVQLIRNTVPQKTLLIHCSGEITRGQIVENLHAVGFNARRDVYYKTVPMSGRLAMQMDNIDIILLHSPMAAKVLRNRHLDLSNTVVISLSEAVDEALSTLVTGERRIANSPDEAALLACLPS